MAIGDVVVVAATEAVVVTLANDGLLLVVFKFDRTVAGILVEMDTVRRIDPVTPLTDRLVVLGVAGDVTTPPTASTKIKVKHQNKQKQLLKQIEESLVGDAIKGNEIN